MRKKLQLLLDDDELREIERIARVRRITVAEWVRHAILFAAQGESQREVGRKLEVVRAAALHSYPTCDVEQMLGEIAPGDSGLEGSLK